jgi:Rad3-related DNA helicase
MPQQHRIPLQLLLDCFPGNEPYNGRPRKAQQDMLAHIAEHGSCLVEAATGSGKSGVAYAFLKAGQKLLESKGETGPLYWVTPTKALVGQILDEFPNDPDIKTALGRNDHVCLYYIENKEAITSARIPLLLADPVVPRADEIPCLSLVDCPHRVDQETGETYGEGVFPCPYYQQRYEAKQGKIVVCTTAFHLFQEVFKKRREPDEPPDPQSPRLLVIDEGHGIHKIYRHCLSYEITNSNLKRCIELLKRIEETTKEEIAVLRRFLRAMRRIVRRKPYNKNRLLSEDEIKQFVAILGDISGRTLLTKVRQAIRDRVFNPRTDAKVIKKLEVLCYDLPRYLHSLEYSLPPEEREHTPKRGKGALNYTCAFYRVDRSRETDPDKRQRIKTRYKLVIKAYYVAPLIRKVLAPLTLVMSATIGKPDIFGYVSGITPEQFPFLRLGSPFPINNTRVYLPTNTPNLARNSRKRGDLNQTLRRMAKACKRLARKGHRSMVVTISHEEREKFLEVAHQEGLATVSYRNNGRTARQAAEAFKAGEGETLVGTARNFGEGIDLPKQTAPVIFLLRPGYPRMDDPEAQFEEKRFGGKRWPIWTWEVAQEAIQVRGRNIRYRDDRGVTILVSQNFKRFAYGSLPDWLKPAYRGSFTLEECVLDTERLLAQR